MATRTRRRIRIKEREPEEQRLWEEQALEAWRAAERKARNDGSWPQFQWLFELLHRTGEPDLFALMDGAVAALAERVGLEPCPKSDGPPARAMFARRRSDWHDRLEDRLRPLGVRDVVGQALVELGARHGLTWPPTPTTSTPNSPRDPSIRGASAHSRL